MKCQSLFSGKIRKRSLICRLLNLPRVVKVNRRKKFRMKVMHIKLWTKLNGSLTKGNDPKISECMMIRYRHEVVSPVDDIKANPGKCYFLIIFVLKFYLFIL